MPLAGAASRTTRPGQGRRGECKSSINAAPTLSASAKTKLATICDEAAKGDPASLKKAEAKVCVELVKDTVPASAQTQALASCPKA